MRTIPVSAERSYQIEVGVDWKVAQVDWIEGRDKVLVICSEAFSVDTGLPTIRIPDGESGKSYEVLQSIWQKLAELGLSRNDLIIAIGGGAVTDVAGFAAATWLRGIDWLAIPTTVAAMVDAAIGGKTAINQSSGKNLVGSFHSPVGVLIDIDFLKSLPARDFAAGLAEVAKCGFIADSQILEILEASDLEDLRQSPNLQMELIYRAAAVKAEVVSSDFKESFQREILNYGHTLGHAIEKDSNYTLKHGEAISIGLCFAAELSKLVNQLDQSVVDRHYQILGKLGLPTSYSKDAWDRLKEIISSDKKNRRGKLRFVGLNAVSVCNRIEAPQDEILLSAYERIAK